MRDLHMRCSTYRFALDLQKHQSQMSIAVYAHDSAVRFYITLTDGGLPYYIEDGCRAVFYGMRPDDEPLIHNCMIEGNHRIIYDFNESTAKEVGITECQICLYGADGRLISAPRFIIVVDERVVTEMDLDEEDKDKCNVSALDELFGSEVERDIAENGLFDEKGNLITGGRVQAEEARVEAESARVEAENEREQRVESFIKETKEDLDGSLSKVVPILERPKDEETGEYISGWYFYGIPSAEATYGDDIHKLMLIRGGAGRVLDGVVVRDKHGRFMIADPEFDFEGDDEGYLNLNNFETNYMPYYAANRGWTLEKISNATKDKLDKIIPASNMTSNYLVYAVSKDGKQWSLMADSRVINSSLVFRDSNGNFNVKAPSGDNNPTPKSYVDGIGKTLSDEQDRLDKVQVLMQESLSKKMNSLETTGANTYVYSYSKEGNSSIRVTSGGTGNTIPLKDGSGNFYVGAEGVDPPNPRTVVNRDYVDRKIEETKAYADGIVPQTATPLQWRDTYDKNKPLWGVKFDTPYVYLRDYHTDEILWAIGDTMTSVCGYNWQPKWYAETMHKYVINGFTLGDTGQTSTIDLQPFIDSPEEITGVITAKLNCKIEKWLQ